MKLLPVACVFQNLDLATNPVVMIAISIIIFVYLVLVFAFWKMDRLDLKRISMIPLCGQDGSHKYEVTVVTGTPLGAGQFHQHHNQHVVSTLHLVY